MNAPLLACEDLRVDADGVPACDGLALTTTANRVLVLGAPRALFDAIIGVAPIARGSVRVQGVLAPNATKEGIVAGAPYEPPLPPRFTLREYVVWSARLAGSSAADAAPRADDAIEKLQLRTMATTPLARTSPQHARRAAVVAAAMATGAKVIVLEDPLGALPDETAQAFAKILVSALEDRSWIVVAPRVALTSPLAMAAEEAIVVGNHRVDAQGTPQAIASAARRYRARVQGPIESLTPQLVERGAALQIDGAHVLLDLGSSLTTADFAALCAASNVAVVELVPIARALS